jgi:hypothetical protein
MKEEELEFTVKYKSYTLFIYEIIESEDITSYLGEAITPHYRWRQEGKNGFFKVVDKFKDEVNKYLELEDLIDLEQFDDGDEIGPDFNYY